MTQSQDFSWAIAFAWWLIFKMVSFLEYLVFLERFFAQNNSKCFVECILTSFLHFYFFTKSQDFPWAIAFAWWLIFKMVSVLEYLVFLKRFFPGNNSKWFVEWILTCFLEFYFLTQSDDFAKAIGLAWWPIFKMVSFLKYLVFLQAVFCREQL